ncbi:putative histidine transporter YuiF (NhaC family) [Arthrobacter sp. V1I9]|nr:putative histidine transporter YuiF (NhaC family) [Arthrobacter sp. V1I9]
MLLVQTAALTACAVLAGLAVFQAALLAGAPLGRFAWGGQHNVLPHGLRVGSAVSIVLYAAFGYAALAKANMVPPLGDETVTSVIAWVLTGYFVLGVLMNAISRSKPERTVMTPVALLLAIAYLVLAVN